VIKTVGGFQPDEERGQGTTLEQIIWASMKNKEPVRMSVVTGVPRSPDEPPPSGHTPNGSALASAKTYRL
jgi:hypothetical protein